MKGIILNNGYCFLNNQQTLALNEAEEDISSVTLTFEPKMTKQTVIAKDNESIKEVIVNPVECGNVDIENVTFVDSNDGFYQIEGISKGFYDTDPVIKISKDKVIDTLGITEDKIVEGKEIAGIAGTQQVLHEESFENVLASADIKQFTDSTNNTWDCRYLEIPFNWIPSGITCYTNQYDQMECISCDSQSIISMRVEPNGIPLTVRWNEIVYEDGKIIIPLLVDNSIRCKYSGTIWGTTL